MAGCNIVPSSQSDCCAIHTGIGTPSNSLGSNGSIYINKRAPYAFYEKKNGVWRFIGNLQQTSSDANSGVVILNNLSGSSTTGAMTDEEIYAYTVNSLDLTTNGDALKVICLLNATNDSTDTNEVDLAWYLNGVKGQNSYVLRNPSQEMYLRYELVISRVSATEVSVDECLRSNYGEVSTDEIFSQHYTSTVNLSLPNTFPLKLIANATSATITGIQLMVIKYKLTNSFSWDLGSSYEEITVNIGIGAQTVNHTLGVAPKFITITDSTGAPIPLDIVTAMGTTSITLNSLSAYNNAKIYLKG